MRKSTANPKNYQVCRMGLLLLFVPAVVLCWPASAQEYARMQRTDSACTWAVRAETATYPGGVVAFQAWAYERTAQRIVAVAVAEYCSSLAPRGSVRNWDSGRLSPAQRRMAVKEWCDRNLPVEGAVTASFTITEKGRVGEVQASGASDALETVLRQALVRSAPWIAAQRLSEGQWRSVPSRFLLPIRIERLCEQVDKLMKDGTGTAAAR